MAAIWMIVLPPGMTLIGRLPSRQGMGWRGCFAVRRQELILRFIASKGHSGGDHQHLPELSFRAILTIG